MTASDSWGKTVVRISLLLCVLSFLLMAYSGFEYGSNTDDKILEQAKKEANTKASNASKNISNELIKLIYASNLAEGIIEDLSSGELNNDSMIQERILDELERYPDIFSIAIAYSPDAFNQTLHSLHYKRNGSAVMEALIEYNYTIENDKNNMWYTKAMKEKRAVWNPPYFGIAADTYLVDYSVPFYLAEFRDRDEPAGVVCVSYSLEGIRDEVGKLNLGTTGYGFILSEEKVIVSYPVQEYMFKNISEVAKEDRNLDLLGDKLSENMKNVANNNITAQPSLSFFENISSTNLTSNLTLGSAPPNEKIMNEVVITNNMTGQSSWVLFKNISSTNLATNWTLGIVLPQKEILLDKEIEQDRSVINFVLAAFAFLFSLSLLLTSPYGHDNRRFWLLAFIFSFLCILGMGVIWHFTLNESSIEERNGDIVVFDMADVETVLLHYDTNPEAPRIPTGVFIQSMEFSTANEVIMTGYIWQDISELAAEKASSKASSQELKETTIKLVTEKTSPSFSFPESKETTIEKFYTDEDRGIIGWRFKTTLRQQFDYSRYPFDEEDVWIKFWNNASEGSVLVPDFDSYDSLVPEKRPGLENTLVLEGWKPQKTFFSYRVNSYNTNFGVEDFKHSNVSELYFNVDVKRDFKSPFVSDLLPIMVVATLLFVVLSITTREEKKNQFGFNSSAVLAYCASLFFVLIIAHSSLRSKIPTDSVIYLEYFYLIMYLAILAVSLNSIVFAARTDIPFIDAKDNLYVKLLYWPVIAAVLLLITLMNFY